MILGDQIAKVREITHDTTQSDYRVTDLQILRFLCEGIDRLYAVRPVSRCAGNDVVRTQGEWPTAEMELRALDVGVDPRWACGVVCYAVARCFELNVTDSVALQLRNDYFQRADAEFMS